MFASSCSEKGKLGEGCILVPKIYIFFFTCDSFCVIGFVSSRISVGSKLCHSAFYSLLICCFFFLLHSFILVVCLQAFNLCVTECCQVAFY